MSKTHHCKAQICLAVSNEGAERWISEGLQSYERKELLTEDPVDPGLVAARMNVVELTDAKLTTKGWTLQSWKLRSCSLHSPALTDQSLLN